MSLTKSESRLRIKRRIRKNIFGSATKPRLSVFRSNKQISVQVISDLDGTTIVSASSLEKEISGVKVNKVQQANLVGKLIAKKALDKGITEVVFDRNGYLYHGRIKSLAEAAREGGLKL